MDSQLQIDSQDKVALTNIIKAESPMYIIGQEVCTMLQDVKEMIDPEFTLRYNDPLTVIRNLQERQFYEGIDNSYRDKLYKDLGEGLIRIDISVGLSMDRKSEELETVRADTIRLLPCRISMPDEDSANFIKALINTRLYELSQKLRLDDSGIYVDFEMSVDNNHPSKCLISIHRICDNRVKQKLTPIVKDIEHLIYALRFSGNEACLGLRFSPTFLYLTKNSNDGLMSKRSIALTAKGCFEARPNQFQVILELSKNSKIYERTLKDLKSGVSEIQKRNGSEFEIKLETPANLSSLGLTPATCYITVEIL